MCKKIYEHLTQGCQSVIGILGNNDTIDDRPQFVTIRLWTVTVLLPANGYYSILKTSLNYLSKQGACLRYTRLQSQVWRGKTQWPDVHTMHVTTSANQAYGYMFVVGSNHYMYKCWMYKPTAQTNYIQMMAGIYKVMHYWWRTDDIDCQSLMPRLHVK